MIRCCLTMGENWENILWDRDNFFSNSPKRQKFDLSNLEKIGQINLGINLSRFAQKHPPLTTFFFLFWFSHLLCFVFSSNLLINFFFIIFCLFSFIVCVLHFVFVICFGFFSSHQLYFFKHSSSLLGCYMKKKKKK